MDFAIIDQLLESGADVNATSNSTGWSVMHEVAANWNEIVAEYLIKRGATIHLKDEEGRTPLHVAASTNHTEMVVCLIEHGAGLEERTTVELQTPLHHATRNDAVEALQMLIEKGCIQYSSEEIILCGFTLTVEPLLVDSRGHFSWPPI